EELTHSMIRRFFIALQFLTRLPVPRSLNSSETDIGKAAAFFPLVGVIVGGGAALVFVVLQRILPLPASVFCAIVFAAFLTNGFHEDGLADSFDGLAVAGQRIAFWKSCATAVSEPTARWRSSSSFSESSPSFRPCLLAR